MVRSGSHLMTDHGPHAATVKGSVPVGANPSL